MVNFLSNFLQDPVNLISPVSNGGGLLDPNTPLMSVSEGGVVRVEED